MLAKCVSPPWLGTAPVDRHVELAVRPELVDAQHGDLGVLRMARALGRVRVDHAEAAAVVQELLDGQLLARDHQHVVIEPRAVDRSEAGLVQPADVDPPDLGPDLRSQAVDFDPHGALPPTS